MSSIRTLKWCKKKINYALMQRECYDYLYALQKEIDKKILIEQGISRGEYLKVWWKEKVCYIKLLLGL